MSKEESMPTYEYECQNCQYCFEEFQSMSAKKLICCPKCSRSTLKRLIGAGAAIIIKGTTTPCYGGRKRQELKEVRDDNKRKLQDRKRKADNDVKKNPPWWRSNKDKKVNMDVLKNPEQYVKTGEMD